MLIVILISIIIFLINKKRIILLSDNEYIIEFQKLLKSSNYPIVKIFGYTGEVVNNDLITYLDRYCDGIEIRYLHRNWIIEELDENNHNKKIENKGRRHWHKSKVIKKLAFEDWNYNLKRNIRYYKHQPIIKGAIFCEKNQKPIIAYINFQKWIPFPTNGGSIFKSVPSEMIKINVKENSKLQELIERIDSQFEYEWHYGSTKEEIDSNKKGDNYAKS